MTRAEILENTENLLTKAGFQLSERCVARRSCFDLIARKEEQLPIFKGFVNLVNVSNEEPCEFNKI
ncbi:hypothetical protein KAS14_01330, partial [Candidatus Bathyarchaeota archaeon]|nr:hypothetical protein [Candidatus Bathyarchaeota archaeon]